MQIIVVLQSFIGKQQIRLIRKLLSEIPVIKIVEDDIFGPNPVQHANSETTAIVSPANSFGWMDGGIDELYIEKFGTQLEQRVQHEINSKYHGELIVGNAFVLPIQANEQPLHGFAKMIVAPTMQTPQIIRNSLNVYLCFRAILIQADKHHIETVVMPCLGTGCGEMTYKDMCMSMVEAWEQVSPYLQRF